MKIIPLIWSLLSHTQKKTFVSILLFGIVVLILEIISISSVFPVVYSINDENFYEKFIFLNDYKEFFSKNQFNLSLVLLLALFLVVTLKNSLMTYFYWLESKFIIQTQEKLSKNLYNNLLNQDFTFHQNNNSAELITRIRTDSIQIREAISAMFKLFQSTIFILGILIFLIIIEPIGFAITFLVFFSMGTTFNFLTSKKSIEIGQVRQEQEILRTKKLQESFGGIKEIKTFLKNYLFIKEYEKLSKKIAEPYYIKMFLSKLPTIFLEILIILIILVLMLFLIINDSDTSKVFALLGVFGVSAIKIIPHLKTILNSFNAFKFSKEPIEFYSNKVKNENNLNNTKNFTKFNFNKNIIFKNIDFKYPTKNKYIFQNLSFEIKKNEKILLSGPTGSGKSTLIDLILGLQKPSNGKILVDGKEVSEIGDSWINILGYVPQSIFLFDDTIKNNITLKENNNFDQKLFEKCIEIAELKEFVQKLPNKENSFIGELGSNISGGQKQRIGIARALYKNSQVIILDEATNALDIETENNIYANLATIKDKTFIVVNHRAISRNFNYKEFSIMKNRFNEK